MTTPLRIRLLSDLHTELNKIDNLDFKKEADVVILAGDIGYPYRDDYIKLLEKLSLTHTQVIVITGNHEYYSDKTMSKIDSKITKLCADESDIHFLQTNTYIYQRVKFIGCTLWSNPTDKTLCKYMSDLDRISTSDKSFTFDKYVSKHLMHKEWLENELSIAKSDDYDKVCVITHHLPSTLLINAEYTNHPLNSFFASDINTTNADVWCYGHTHIANHGEFDIGTKTKFYCNPRGYAHEKSGWNMDFIFEM